MERGTEKREGLRLAGEIARMLLPVLLYLGAHILAKAALTRLPGAPPPAESLVPVALMLPVTLCYGREKGQRSRCVLIGLALAAASAWALAHGRESLRALIGFALAGPVNEEIVYRGFAYRRGKRAFGTKGAALLSALLFAAGHASLSAMPAAFCAGLLFAALAERTGGVEAPAALHALYNVVQMVLSGA